MLIQGSVLSERTNILINKYIELLENDIDADSILVLVQNSFKKDLFINKVKAKLKKNYFISPQIHTFYGLCYNTVLNCWPEIQQTIKDDKAQIIPSLNGLELSHFFWKQAIKEVGFSDYNSKINLIHQLFRRYSLITNNNLSTDEINTRTNILKESFAKDAKSAIDIFKKKTIKNRSFDYIRQTSIFNYIANNTNHFANIKYLIIDDADEIPQIEFEFIKKLYPQLNDIFVGYDNNGPSRLGFLNADTETIKNIETLLQKEILKNLDNITNIKTPITKTVFSNRIKMIENAIEQIKQLLKSGVQPPEISIVTPNIDSAIKFLLTENFKQEHINFQFLSGSEKLCDNPIIQNIFTLLNLVLEQEIDDFKIRFIFSKILKIPLKYCLQVITNYKENKKITFVDLKSEIYNKKLKRLISTINEAKKKETLSEKIFLIYENLLIEQNQDKNTLSKINFLMKQINDFEIVISEQKNSQDFQKNILTQLENSIISENPSATPEFEENAIIISTAQKLIDFSIKTKHVFLLDTTSDEWIKDDFGTLYNAWVFQKSWTKNSFEYKDNIELSTLKTQKMLRKLCLLATDNIYAYSSLYDSKGNENGTGIDAYLIKNEQKQNETFSYNFVPRDDQKPILEYTNGNLAISAVPGAGKTTILLALIIKLLQRGIKSENIFVLTFMESAARNFKERIQNAFPSLEKLPNISTIHGLALRILKENSNFTKVGLNENFEICDDSQRQKIIWEVFTILNLQDEEYDKYDKAISILKLSDNSKQPFSKDNEIKKFIKFYNTYNNYLKTKNLIDYDDMLLYSVKILEQNPDIASYYANICEYIIEDEAQDSSGIQQRLLKILSSKHKNLIRCGDINQAITTTFTNSDLDGFKTFVKNSKNITMNYSQRCTKEIFELANKLIDYSKTKEEYQKAFFDIKMQEVKGKNPISENAVSSIIFEDYEKELSFILENIRKIFTQDQNASIAILVRNNSQVEEYANYFRNFGYDIETKTGSLKNQPTFALTKAILNFILHPWQNETVLECAEILKDQRLIELTTDDICFLKNTKNIFILENQDNLTQTLSQLLWDLLYWLENSNLNAEELTIKIGHHYYSSEVEKANTYITALLMKTIESQYKTKEAFVNQVTNLSTSSIGTKFKFYDKNAEEQENKNNNGKIQIMTYHKSKGDEFDYVFIPEMVEDSYLLPFNLETIKIKSKERFYEAIKRLNLNYKHKDEQAQKTFQIEENLRLMYVAITRAKKKLFITTAKKYKRYSRLKDTKPSIIFEELLTDKK